MDFATYQQQRFMQLMSSVGVASLDLLGGMSASLGLLNLQMAELRAANATQVALQQLILQRDELQQHLEELVYQGQKMVEGFTDPADKTPTVQKALLLRSFYRCVTKAGIGTGAIRGLQNKRVFDGLMSQAKSLYRQLGHDPAVRNAVAKEESAEKRQLEEQQRLEAEEAQRLAEEAQRLAESHRRAIAVFDAVVQTAKRLGYTIGSSDHQVGLVCFQTGTSWSSFGQDVQITILDHGDGTYSMRMSHSHSQLTDWGEGGRIAKKVFEGARAILRREGLSKVLVSYDKL